MSGDKIVITWEDDERLLVEPGKNKITIATLGDRLRFIQVTQGNSFACGEMAVNELKDNISNLSPGEHHIGIAGGGD
jgi:hypothetical protein